MKTNTQILWESVQANPGKTAQWHEAHLDFKATTSIMTNMQKRGMVRRTKQRHFNDDARMIVAYHYEVVGTTYKFMPLPPNVVKEAATNKRPTLAQVMLGAPAGKSVEADVQVAVKDNKLVAEGEVNAYWAAPNDTAAAQTVGKAVEAAVLQSVENNHRAAVTAAYTESVPMTEQQTYALMAKACKPRTLTPADCGLTNEKFVTAYEETAADLVDRLPIRRAKEVFVILQGIFGV